MFSVRSSIGDSESPGISLHTFKHIRATTTQTLLPTHGGRNIRFAKLEQEENLIPASSVEDAVNQLEGQRIIWMMLPAGEVTEKQIDDLIPMLNPGDIIVDGGNSNYKHSVKIGAMLKEHNIGFMDCGTSGGVWGLDNGYCLMVGADNDVAKAVEPVLRALAPNQQDGWLHVGPIGSGHYTKMIHNGIEYGMMESFAEGLELLKGKTEFDIDLAKVTELWRHGSVVRSWLLDLTAESLKGDQNLGCPLLLRAEILLSVVISILIPFALASDLISWIMSPLAF